MEKDRIRIGTRSINLYQTESEINRAVNEINGQLRVAIESIGFVPSEELFNDCLDGGQTITQAYYERLEKELSILSIPSSKELFQKSGEEGLKKFHSIRKQLVEKCGSSVRKYISFNDNLAVFSDEAKKQLDEDFGIYIENPEEIDLYNLHVKACEALNLMFQGHKSIVWNQLFEFEKGIFKPNPQTNYAALLLNIQIAKENGK